MDPSVVVERAKKDELGFVASIHNICFRDQISHLAKYGYHEVDAKEVERWFGRGQILLARTKERIIGYLDFAVCENQGERYGVAVENEPHWLGQGKIGVLPEERRRGVASTLIRHAIRISRSAGCADFRVSVYSDNTPARRLLDKLRFKRITPDVVLAERDLRSPLPQCAPPKGVTIEPGNPQNIDGYVAFFDQIRTYYGSYSDARSYVRGILTDDESAGCLFAKSGGQVVGCILADKVANSGFIGLPGVLPEHRRRGIGSALMASMLALLRNKGFEVAVTDSETSRQPALRLYWRTGFTEARRRLSYRHGCQS